MFFVDGRFKRYFLKLSGVPYSEHTAQSHAHPEQLGPVTTCHSAGGFGFP